MTEQERQLIQGLVARIQNAPAPQIDRDADDLIRRSITRPDALYLLVQTVLVQDMALNQAKAQIDELKQRNSPAAASGFLPKEPNMRPPQPGNWGQETRLQQPAPQSRQDQGDNYPPPPQPAAPSSGFGSFFRSAATTAAGVIAGETAFSALSSIFGHHGGYSGGSGFLSGAPISPGSEETVINNYYDDDRGHNDDRRFAADDDMRNIDDDQNSDDQGNQNDDDTDGSSDTDDVSSGDDYSDNDGSVDV